MWNMGKGESLAQSHGPITEACTDGNLGSKLVEEDTLAGEIIQTLGKCGSYSTCKDGRVS